MRLYGLVGHPLEHSFSKNYFNEKFEKEQLDCQYLNFDLKDLTELPDLLHTHPELKGFNVTAPYKEIIIPYLDEYDAEINEIKSVNTVLINEYQKLKGFNTDIIGFKITIENLLKYNKTKDYNTLILGTGGASKAVQWVLKKSGIPFKLVSRTASRGDITYQQVTQETLEKFNIIINATPVGLYPNVDAAPALPYEALTSNHCLIDLNYNPQETLFLRYGKEKGAITCNGLPMLYAQAEASWRIWNKHRP